MIEGIQQCVLDNLLLFLITLVVVTLSYCKYHAHNYWKRKSVPYLKPSLPFGNMKHLIAGQSIGIISKEFYDEFKQRGAKFGGIYALFNPILVVVDLELTKSIMTKDFQYFVNRGVYYNEKFDPLAPDLFNIGGTRWKNVRVGLSPNYTSGKMRMMFPTMVECCQKLEAVLQRKSIAAAPVDVKEICCCFTTDVNFLVSFGLECNSLENPDLEFRRFGKTFFGGDLWKEIKHFMSIAMPEVSRNIGIVTRSNEVTKFFRNLFTDTIKLRQEYKYEREDLLQFLINMMQNEAVENKSRTPLTVDEVAAHCLLFFIASFETSSTTMNFCLYELARHQEIQKKVRDEIRRIVRKYNEEITYEAIMEMTYLGQVVDETLRMYPPVPTLNRECTIDYKIPGTEVVIEKGTSVLISTLGLHTDPDIFPNPYEFDPDRFCTENKGNIPSYAYLPFGEGPRNCIGLRFGLLQVKLGLAAMLRNYEFRINSKSKEISIHPKAFLLRTIDTIWMDISKTSAYS